MNRQSPRPDPAAAFTVDLQDLKYLGRKLVQYIKEEAAKDAAKSSTVPTSSDFYESFSFQVVRGSVEIVSTWPWLEVLMEGTDGPYPMPWLTRAQGIHKVPLVGRDGQVVIRSTPLTTDKAWIHPGIARHTFIQRAFTRAIRDCTARMVERSLDRVLGAAFKR